MHTHPPLGGSSVTPEGPDPKEARVNSKEPSDKVITGKSATVRENGHGASATGGKRPETFEEGIRRGGHGIGIGIGTYG